MCNEAKMNIKIQFGRQACYQLNVPSDGAEILAQLWTAIQRTGKVNIGLCFKLGDACDSWRIVKSEN